MNALLLNWSNRFADTPWCFIGKALEVSKSIANIRKGSTNFSATLTIAGEYWVNHLYRKVFSLGTAADESFNRCGDAFKSYCSCSKYFLPKNRQVFELGYTDFYTDLCLLLVLPVFILREITENEVNLCK